MEAKAHLKYLRISPRKVSILCDIIRGKDAKTACVYLMQRAEAPWYSLWTETGSSPIR